MGDPHQEIARICSERGWLTLHTNDRNLEFLQRGATWQIEHPKGYFQPGVLALTRDKRLLYRWRSIPSAENMQGTLARPTATYVWAQIEKALNAGDTTGDAALDDDPTIDRVPGPRVLFFAALLANGWFLRAKSLVYSPGISVGPSRMPKLFARWILFLAFWIVAFVVLPSPLAGLGLIGWAAWVMHDIRSVFGRPEVAQETS